MSKYMLLTANDIRKNFLDYFIHNGHSFIRSSRVQPFGDHSLEFVNAGMNQFKNVFLGLEKISIQRAANSQKCIRVGGKHNDLRSVGHDSYHHTFFEMLGNWSFNDYFKEEACRLAWTLLTNKPFALDPNRLYVTYFGGDRRYNLKSDLETKEIWIKLGVNEERILPFGLKDNFWEMGPSGPCGACTEIHYDHLGLRPRPQLVNSDRPDLTELWNLVFIEYNRSENGELERLKKRFVDTGMGFERLVALLQGKTSNYDSDLFTPYFTSISKMSGCREYGGKFSYEDIDGLDTAYRILADHSRMISIAIADNIFPDESHGLRRVIRKALSTAAKFIPGNDVQLLVELTRVACQTFGDHFQEAIQNQKQIEYVIQDEKEVWEQTKSKVKTDWENLLSTYPQLADLSDVRSPGMVAALKEYGKLKKEKGTHLPQEFVFNMYDRHGLNTQVIKHLANLLGHTIDTEKLEKDILHMKKTYKLLSHSTNKSTQLPRDILEYAVNNFELTDDSFKINYRKDDVGNYFFPSLKTRINAIIAEEKVASDISQLREGSEIIVLLEKTNLWSGIGDGDRAEIAIRNNSEHVAEVVVQKVLDNQGFIYHYGTLHLLSKKPEILVRDSEVEIFLDEINRMNIMRNTTAAHLLAFVFRKKFVSSLKYLIVSSKNFVVKFAVYGQNITDTDMKLLEEETNDLVNKGCDVNLTRIPANAITNMPNVFIPPFIKPATYQYFLASFNVNDSLREITIGPNVMNTKDVMRICLTKIEKKKNNREIIITGVSGEFARVALKNTEFIINMLSPEVIASKDLVQQARLYMRNNHIPWDIQCLCDKKLRDYESLLKKAHGNDTFKKNKGLHIKIKKNS